MKNFGRLDFVRALFEAYDREAKYAVLLDGDGNVTEGRGWNIFSLYDGRLVSPDSGVLEGITRRTVIELSDTLNIDCQIGKLPAETLQKAEEVFITSTAGGVMPVRSVDGEAVGDGHPGPVTLRDSKNSIGSSTRTRPTRRPSVTTSLRVEHGSIVRSDVELRLTSGCRRRRTLWFKMH